MQVNGDYGKFCIENNITKISNGDLQRITFSGVRDMDEAKRLIDQLVCPLDHINEKFKPMVIVHMVVACCRLQHYMVFQESNSQLLYSITRFKLQNILKVQISMEMHTSMLFIKVMDWNGLLEWMETGSVIGVNLQAYRKACADASASQIPFAKEWAKYNGDDNYEKYMKDLDSHTHMIARVTMNGFVQLHLMWNKEPLLLLSPSSSFPVKRKKQDKFEKHYKVGGVFWTEEVEIMAKMRMGLIMHAIEILS